MTRSTKLRGRVFIYGEIETKTGLRIGDTQGALTIGGVDLPVIRNKRTNEPYIPGSSLKGKMRSLGERALGAPLNFTVNQGKRDGQGKVEIHSARNASEYKAYWVNPLFGVTGDGGDWIEAPNRLIVRDVPLTPTSREDLLNAKTDLPFTEVKWEAAIDRVTAAATPRQIERVPAGAVFGPMEIVFNAYLSGDAELFWRVIEAMQLLEDDYLGGHGSRGSGKIAFCNLSLKLRYGPQYVEDDKTFGPYDLPKLIGQREPVLNWLKGKLMQ
jgi:CRISPR-associated protein Csm3